MWNPFVVYTVFADRPPDQNCAWLWDNRRHPFDALTKNRRHGETPEEVFNGYCGAESGYRPVSAASPAILNLELDVTEEAIVQEGRPFAAPSAMIIRNPEASVMRALDRSRAFSLLRRSAAFAASSKADNDNRCKHEGM